MKSLGKTLLLTASMMTVAFACTCEKKMDKGPNQEPFKKCKSTDSDCEKGSCSTEDFKKEEAAPVVEKAAPPAAPVVQEAPKTVAPAAPVVKETLKAAEPVKKEPVVIVPAPTTPVIGEKVAPAQKTEAEKQK